eukprot:7326612-Ditylum_brightwellii.AAC.1
MEQTLVTNGKCNKIFKKECSPLCHLCQQKDKIVQHIVSSCYKLAGTKYTKRHTKVPQYAHWNILKEHGIKIPKQWYKHSSTSSVVDGDMKINWGLKIVINIMLEHNCLDIVILDKKNNATQIIDIAVPFDTHALAKMSNKTTKYQDLEIALKRNWK